MDEHEPAPKIVPGAVTFQDRNAMMKVTAVSAVGTLAYIIEEQALLVRVNNGWQYIAVSVKNSPTFPDVVCEFIMTDQLCKCSLFY